MQLQQKETEDQNDADTQVTSTAGETHEDTDTESGSQSVNL